MTDNLANSWGTELVHIGGLERRVANGTTMDSGLFFTRVMNYLAPIIEGKFKPVKIVSNGSEANLFAIFSLTENSSACLLACGSYVGGDLGLVHGYSTSDFANDGPCWIMKPSNVVNTTARKQTVPVPYHIPGVMDAKSLQLYEDQCLLHVHNRCLLQCTQGNPVKGFFLELVLASNGCTLSDRYLKKLGVLAKHHSFKIIVDEIMTSARYGVMLLTGTKPKEFVHEVAFITIGKWIKTGMVLASESQREIMNKNLQGMVSRGTSHSIVVDEASVYWDVVTQCLSGAEQRRRKVLKKLGVKKEDAWGGGTHIFAPLRYKGITRSTQNRFLPLLQDTPINCKVEPVQEWNKVNVNKKIHSQVTLWITDDTLSYQKSAHDYNIMHVIQYYVNQQILTLDDKWYFQQKTIQKHLSDINDKVEVKTGTLTYILSSLEVAKLLVKTKKKNERLRVYAGQNLMQFPCFDDKEEEFNGEHNHVTKKRKKKSNKQKHLGNSKSKKTRIL